MPSQPIKAANASHPDLHPFGTQQLAFHLQIAAIPAERPTRGNHAVTRDAWFGAPAHDVSDGTRGARRACERGDIAIGRDSSWRNAPHGGQDPAAKLAHPAHSRAAWPRVLGRVIVL